MTTGEHERVEHAAFVRNIMGADYVNGVVDGTLTWTARGAGQEVRGTAPSAFNGPQVNFQALPVPQVFEVTYPTVRTRRRPARRSKRS